MSLDNVGSDDPITTTQLSEITDLLEKIAGNSNPATPPARYDLHVLTSNNSGQSNAPTVSLAVQRFVFSVDAACKLTLTVGVATYVFNIPGADTKSVDFPIAIRAGTDCYVALSAGNLGVCYFTYEPIR